MDDVRGKLPVRPVRLIDQIRLEIRNRNLSYATERTYVGWILRFIRFHGRKHPEQLGSEQVEEFLNTWHRHSFVQLKHRIVLHSDSKMLL